MIRTYPFVVPYRPVYGYVVLLAMLLAMSWENALNNAAIVEGAIPREAIRLRILANSDSAPDQAVKRHVRNAVEGELRKLAAGAESVGKAREAIAGALPELEKLVERELETRGFGYGATVKLGAVPFPAKIYGNRVYPAGEYEALLITLGKGQGENWWCVLFPPLCFADAVEARKPEKGTAVARGNASSHAAAGEGKGATEDARDVASGASGAKSGAPVADDDVRDAAGSERDSVSGASGTESGAPAADGDVRDAESGVRVAAATAEDVEVKFAVWELLQRIADFFRKLFG